MHENCETTELEYVEQLLDDFDLSPDDKIADLIEALEDEEADGEDDQG
jgi:hypothetical protein